MIERHELRRSDPSPTPTLALSLAQTLALTLARTRTSALTQTQPLSPTLTRSAGWILVSIATDPDLAHGLGADGGVRALVA